jgi:hypothetical protein
MRLVDSLRQMIVDSMALALRKADQSPDRVRHSQIEQVQLVMQYRQMLQQGLELPSFEDVGFRVFSESDEDGILLYIFALIGTTNRVLVDLGASIGGSNTANLLVNHGWTGLLLEGDPDRAAKTAEFYASCTDTKNYPPKIVSSWMTRDNIDSLLAENGMEGEVDLLSIDIDGVDYYIWEAIEVISPRVVVVEYQCIWGPERSVSVPYSPDFKGGFVGRYGIYSGASLAAFVKLGRKKGYRLVGAQRYGYNAFFLRNGVGDDILAEISPQECFRHPFTQWAQKELLPKVSDLEWVEI